MGCLALPTSLSLNRLGLLLGLLSVMALIVYKSERGYFRKGGGGGVSVHSWCQGG